MSDIKDSKGSKDSKSSFSLFYVVWGLFFFFLLISLIYIQVKVSESSSIFINIDGPVDFLKKFEETTIQAFKNELDSIKDIFTLMSFTSAFFGMLITAISIFFALRESIRVDKIINEYQNKIDNYNNLESEFRKKFDDFINKLKEQSSEKSENSGPHIITDLKQNKFDMSSPDNTKLMNPGKK